MSDLADEKRKVFGLHGISGALIAVVLLLSIVVWFTIWGLGVQQENAENFYTIDKEKVKMFSTENGKHIRTYEAK